MMQLISKYLFRLMITELKICTPEMTTFKEMFAYHKTLPEIDPHYCYTCNNYKVCKEIAEKNFFEGGGVNI